MLVGVELFDVGSSIVNVRRDFTTVKPLILSMRMERPLETRVRGFCRNIYNNIALERFKR